LNIQNSCQWIAGIRLSQLGVVSGFRKGCGQIAKPLQGQVSGKVNISGESHVALSRKSRRSDYQQIVAQQLGLSGNLLGVEKQVSFLSHGRISRSRGSIAESADEETRLPGFAPLPSFPANAFSPQPARHPHWHSGAVAGMVWAEWFSRSLA